MASNTTEHELADVVVAARSQDNGAQPWYVTLRPWLFCLLFLCLVELAARLYFDGTLCLQTQRFDIFPTAAMENAFVAQMQRDTAYKVVLIGDSTIVGSALLNRDQTTPRYLQADLQRVAGSRPIHVWNFSLAGARSTDMLCLLEKVLQGRPDFLAIEGNYFISAIGVGNLPIAEPWLAYNLPAVPSSIQPLLKISDPNRDSKTAREYALTQMVENNIRFVGMRQAINARLFGVQPRVTLKGIPFKEPNPLVMAGASLAQSTGQLSMQPWYQRGLAYAPATYAPAYQRNITPDELNTNGYRAVVARLQQCGVPCMTYMTPQNPAIIQACMIAATYQKRKAVLAQAMSGPGVPNADYCDLVPDKYFNDNDHMMPEGNKMLADALAVQIAPRIQAAMAGEARPQTVARIPAHP